MTRLLLLVKRLVLFQVGRSSSYKLVHPIATWRVLVSIVLFVRSLPLQTVSRNGCYSPLELCDTGMLCEVMLCDI